MGIIEFLKIKLFSGKKVLTSLTSINERLEYAKGQLYVKKEKLEKSAENVHQACLKLQDKIEVAEANSTEALAMAKKLLQDGKEDESKVVFRQHSIAERASKRYKEALEKAEAQKTKLDEAVTNYDATIADVESQIQDLKIDMEINNLTDYSMDDGVPTEIADFLTKIETEIKDKSYEQKAKAEVKSLTRLSTIKMNFGNSTINADFEKFKASVH